MNDMLIAEEAADLLGWTSGIMRDWPADGGREVLHGVDTPDGLRFPRERVEKWAALLAEIGAQQAANEPRARAAERRMVEQALASVTTKETP